MEIFKGRNGELRGIVCRQNTKTFSDLKNAFLVELGLEEGDETRFYFVCKGKVVGEDSELFSGCQEERTVISIVPRVLGGKGGFGSMLRAIGAQIEKTTNRDACRDLSGRRLRDINEEQRLKKWFAKQAERELEKAEAKKRKLERLKQLADGPPLPKIDDQDYLQQRADMVESVFEAVDKGFEASKAPAISEDPEIAADSSNSSSSSQSDTEAVKRSPESESCVTKEDSSGSSNAVAGPSKSVQSEKKVVKKTMLDDDLCSGSSDEDSDDETITKKAKLG